MPRPQKDKVDLSDDTAVTKAVAKLSIETTGLLTCMIRSRRRSNA